MAEEQMTPAPWVLKFDQYENHYVLNEGVCAMHISIDGCCFIERVAADLQLIRNARRAYDALKLCERALEIRDAEAEEHAAKQAREVLAAIHAPLEV